MNDDNGSMQGLLGGLRVPIDPRAIILGMVMVVLFGGGAYGLNEAFDSLNLADRPLAFDQGISGFFSSLYAAPCSFQCAIAGWFLILWSLIGGAINRIVAVRLAKDDSIGIKEAVGFSRRRFLSYFLTPIVLVGLIAFMLGCNMLAGLVGKIPYAGPILYILLYVLVLISSLFITILLIGLVFGHNMISSAVSTEGCDGIEASISVYNYIFARPWPFILFTGLVAISLYFLLFVGNFLVNLSFKTTFLQRSISGYEFHWKKDAANGGQVLDQVVIHEVKGKGALEGLFTRDTIVGELLLGRRIKGEERTTTFFADEKDWKERHDRWTTEVEGWNAKLVAEGKLRRALVDQTAKSAEYAQAKDEAAAAAIKTRLDEIQKTVDESRATIAKSPDNEPIEPEQVAAYNWMVWDLINRTPVVVVRDGAAIPTTFGTEHIQGSGATMVRILAWAMLAAYWLLRLLVVGYVVTHLLASYTTIYFVLRREVDGTEYEELFEEDEEPFDFSEESAPKAPASPAPPIGASEPQAAPPTAPPASDKPSTPPPPKPPGT